jgi:HPt (histidine-containing phosphotransfer) domain-containing protein
MTNTQNMEFNRTYLQHTHELINQYEKIVQHSTNLSHEDYNQLFRIVHSIKSNLYALGLTEVSQYVQSFEDQFVSARQHNDLIHNRPLLLQFIFKTRYLLNFATMTKAA